MNEGNARSQFQRRIISRGPAVLFAAGIVCEFSASLICHGMSWTTSTDEALSLLAMVFFSGSALWVIHRMGGIGGITGVVVLAGLLFMFSKGLELCYAMGLIQSLVQSDSEFMYFKILRDSSFALGMFLLLISFLYSALEAHAARHDLALRHAALLKEMEERKRAEQERALLSTAVEQSAESVVITDKNGLIQYVNPAFEHLTGYGRDEAIGRTPRFVRSGKHDAAFYRKLWDTISRGDVWHGHFVNRRKDGSLFDEEATISCMRDEAGNITNYIAIKRDVSNELSLEKQLRQAQKMEAVGTLAGRIAHDFNNMLALIMGHGEIALREIGEDHPAHKNIQHILKAGNRAKSFIRQILTFGRKIEQERRPLEVHVLLNEALDFLRVSLPTTVEIHSHIDENAGVILADSSQIHQVVMNLCTNAFQAMEEARGVLEVSVNARTLEPGFRCHTGELDPGRYACITIQDTGRGMDAETQQHIFEPFFTTKQPGEGTGLGLSIVHGIVTAFGGGVTVRSEPGQGSIFEVYLPLVENTNGAEEIEPDTPLLGKEGIIFIDDDEELVQMNSAALASLGYRVTSCTRASEALEAFSAHPDEYDLIITDQIMPDISGMDLVQTVLCIRPDIPVILVTGYEQGASMEQAKLAGVSEYLMKPVSFHALTHAIRRSLQGDSVLT